MYLSWERLTTCDPSGMSRRGATSEKRHDFDPRHRVGRLPVVIADLGEVRGVFAAAEPGFRVGGQDRDERIYLTRHERALPGPGLKQTLVREPPDGLPDGVPGCLVLLA